MAKFCVNCGANLGDSANFCASCGTQQGAAPQQTQPVQQQPFQQYPPPYAPAPAPKPKNKALPILLGGAALLAVLIIIIAAAGREDSSHAPTPPGYNGSGIPTAGGNPGQATQPQQPSGNLDTNLIGSWNHIRRDMTSLETISSWYIFHENGTFKYSTTWQSRAYYGKYSVSDGTIHFSEVWWFEYLANGEESEHEKRSDFVLDYDFGVNSDGGYLLIYALERLEMDEASWDLTGAYEYLRKDE